LEQPQQDPVLSALHGICGLDASRGLSLTNHNAMLYVTLLGKFVQSQAHTVEDIRQALADADRSTAERLAHTLKGLAASIGAEPLRQALFGIEQAVHDGQGAADIESLLAPANIQLQTLVADLRATPGLIAEQVPFARKALTPTQHVEVQAVVQRLRSLLEQDDSDVLTLWATHAKQLHAVLPQAQALEQAIQGFDFEAALRLMPEKA
jgi:two-component system, sensor histidine kinase and response regulator